MSKCISRHGEYSEHSPDEEFVCGLCGALDEDAMRAEVERLRNENAKQFLDLITVTQNYIDGKRERDALAATVERVWALADGAFDDEGLDTGVAGYQLNAALEGDVE